MAYRVEWSSHAVDDLEAIALYISGDSVAYASSVVKSILSKAGKLSRFPFSGRVVPELADDAVREWFAYSYRIIYRIQNESITIAAVVHDRRQLDIE